MASAVAYMRQHTWVHQHLDWLVMVEARCYQISLLFVLQNVQIALALQNE